LNVVNDLVDQPGGHTCLCVLKLILALEEGLKSVQLALDSILERSELDLFLPLVHGLVLHYHEHITDLNLQRFGEEASHWYIQKDTPNLTEVKLEREGVVVQQSWLNLKVLEANITTQQRNVELVSIEVLYEIAQYSVEYLDYHAFEHYY
jgi:hypothetical protein